MDADRAGSGCRDDRSMLHHLVEATSSPAPPQVAPPRPATKSTIHFAIGICILVFALLAPTLRWSPVRNDIERINIETALELRRSTGWIVPTLSGQPRISKPPLPAWTAALAIRPTDAASIASADPSQRAVGYASVAWEARLPSAMLFCAALLAVYGIGRIAGGADVGVAALLIAASCRLFLSNVRLATVDTQLAAWVTIAQFCIVAALLDRRIWLGAIGGGAALALAFMSKGPIALIQTVLPALCLLVWDHVRKQRSWKQAIRLFSKPALAGLAMFAAIGLWWFAFVAARTPGVAQLWFHQSTRYHTDDQPPDPWFHYALCGRMFLPWIAWLITGAALGLQALLPRTSKLSPSPCTPGEGGGEGSFSIGSKSHRILTPSLSLITWRGDKMHRGLVLIFLMLFVPLLVMSVSPNRKERYLVPLLAPGAVLCAMAAQRHLRGFENSSGADRLVAGAVALTAIGMIGVQALAGATSLKGRDPPPFHWPAAVAVAAAATAIVFAGVVAYRRQRWAMIASIFIASVGVNFFYVYGDAHRPEASSRLAPLAEAVRAQCHGAPVVALYPVNENMFNPETVELSYELGQTVNWAPRWPAADDPAQGVIVAKESNINPPQGWRLLAENDQRRPVMCAFVRTSPKTKKD